MNDELVIPVIDLVKFLQTETKRRTSKWTILKIVRKSAKEGDSGMKKKKLKDGGREHEIGSAQMFLTKDFAAFVCRIYAGWSAIGAAAHMDELEEQLNEEQS